jgi:hypothetical protein
MLLEVNRATKNNIHEVNKMNFLNKLERRFGKFAIKNLMLYIVIANAIVYVFASADPSIVFKFYLIPSFVMKGEVWRLITFVMIPPPTSIIFIFFVLYFYYMIGVTLEHEWGSFKFNLYYFIGMIGTIIASFVTGEIMFGYYINLSLFFAFARLFPDFELLIFFVLPVKIKYLSWISWAFIVIRIVFDPFPGKIAAIVAVINFFIFFGKEIVVNRKQTTKSYYRKREYTAKINPKKDHFHKCEVCGRTEEDDSNLEFRYCSKCDGFHEYCSDHLFNHEHIKK